MEKKKRNLLNMETESRKIRNRKIRGPNYIEIIFIINSFRVNK